MNLTFPQECLDCDATERDECSGPVRYRMTLIARAPCLALCDLHWANRLLQLERASEVYSSHGPPGTWSDVAPAQVWQRVMNDVVEEGSAGS